MYLYMCEILREDDGIETTVMFMQHGGMLCVGVPHRHFGDAARCMYKLLPVYLETFIQHPIQAITQ